jgi:site-specific DNA recombinase
MWMGGPVPLGYVVRDRKLIVDPAEAATVRRIFERYVALSSIVTTADALAQDGFETKITLTNDGFQRGGIPWTRGALAHLLGNRVYIGEVRHRDAHYPGEHAAIIERDLWDCVAAQLADRRHDRRSPRNLRHGNLLGGLLFDGLGRPMRTCSAGKGSRTYHYYASCADAVARDRHAAWRMPARDLEALVVEGVRAFLAEGSRVHDAVAGHNLDRDGLSAVLSSAAVRAVDPDPLACRDLIARIDVLDEQIDILITTDGLLPTTEAEILAARPHRITVPAIRLRRGKEVRLLIPAPDGVLQSSPDPALIKLLANAFAARDAVNAATGMTTLAEVAKSSGYSLEYFSLLLRLSMLAPDIVAAIHKGQQPPSLNRQRLARTANLPVEWAAQRAALGFA